MIQRITHSPQLKAAKLLAALAVAGLAQQAMAAAPAPNALPTGGQVVAGTAAITQAGNTMNINQSSQRAVINWSSFDVGSQAKVNFNQPNAQAATLNYVNSASKSMINGAVNANGQVIFVNNNGVVFGKGAEVNVGGMVATTMNTSAQEFMDGKAIQTYEGGATGKVVNKGHITGNNINSYIALMAPQVKNTGVITATMGGNNAIALVAGEKVSLKFSGSQLVSVSVDASVVNALISNKLLINAGNGQVIIAANAAQNLMGSLIKNTGTVSANGINTSGGKISLTADNIEQSGVVEANSVNANGGQVNLAANNINLASVSKTTATGATAGGNISIGVNAPNTSAATQNNQLANTVSIQENAIVDASATQNGNGGNISIWSQIKTFVAGSLFAKGGAQGGNGGFIETSSKGSVVLAASTKVDTSAPNGKTGSWTIDPIAIIVDSTAASVISNALNTTSVTLDATGSSCAFGACTQSQSPLIQILSDIYSGNTATALNLIANGGQIDINANVTAGAVYAVAQAINVNGSINTNGGSNSNIYLAGAIINILGNINSNGNNQNNSNSSNLNSANTITGANRRNGQNGLTADINTYTSNGGLINIIATNDINVSATSYISSNGINAGAVNIVSTAGNVTINGIVDSIGKAANGGNIAIAGANQLNLIGSLVSSEGLSAGGVINLGQVNNLGNGSTLAPPATAPPALITFVADLVANAVAANPASVTSSTIILDSQTGINAPNGNIVVFGGQIQINNSSITAANGTIAIGREGYSIGSLSHLTAVSNSTLIANKVETSGNLLGTDGVVVLAAEWLLDPTNVTIGTTSTTGTLAGDLANAGVTNIKASDIVGAVNAGGTVSVIATGSITQSAALAFAPAAGVTGTLTLDNRTTTTPSSAPIQISAATTNSGLGTVNLNYYSGGALNIEGNITSTSGKINFLGQSFWANNSFVGSSTLFKGSNIYAGPSNVITTMGGYAVLDATGGVVTGLGDPTGISVSIGTIVNGFLVQDTGASINTTQNGAVVGATTTGGGNVIINTSRANNDGTNGFGAWQPRASNPINAGGTFTANVRATGVAGAGYVVGGYGTTSPISSYGNFVFNVTGNAVTSVPITTGTQKPFINITSAFTSYAGSLTLNANVTGGKGGIWVKTGGVSAYRDVTFNSSSTSADASIQIDNPVISTNGNVSISGTGVTSIGVAATATGDITGSKITINGSSTGAAAATTAAVSLVGNNITVNTVANASYAASMQNAVSITGNIVTKGNAGINSTAIITNNAIGGGISFVTNGDLSQTGLITLAPNTSGNPQNILFDTRTGNQNSKITTGSIAYTAGTPNAVVNYSELANGGALTVGAVTVTGYIQLDNTCLSCTTSGVSDLSPASLAGSLTTAAGLTVSGALQSDQYIAINTLNNSATLNSVALGANTLTVTNKSTAATAISIIGNHNTANVGAPGIASTGVITSNDNGGSLLFKSNGDISQTGAVNVVANTTAFASNITYDTTAGNNASIITAGALTITGTSTSAINYTEITSGAAITAKALNVPGYILLDMTNGGTVAASASTTATGVTVGGNLTAGNLAGATNGIGIYGLSTTGTAVSIGTSTTAYTLTNSVGNVYIRGFESAAGGATGISFDAPFGATTNSIVQNANGGNITLISNNAINHGGNISIAQNTSGVVSNITYDTTFGNRLSTINASNVTFNGTSTSYINYKNIASGAPIIVNSALVVPGSITFDNTYLAGVQGGINTNNAWQYGTIATAQKGIYVTSSLTASNGIYIRGVIGATTASVVSCCNAVDIAQGLSGALTTLQTTGTFAAGTSAIEIIGIQPIYNMTSGANTQNAVKINGNVAINNNSIGGKTNIVAISGHYNDIVSITNASTAGSIDVSAIGLYAQIITISGTVFTQNSNAGIFIASSQNGNVTPPQIINNGTGPVVIEAGAYYPIGTVSTGTCSATACGQITTVSGNTITSPLGDVYLYAGSPGTTAGTTTTPTALNILDTSLNTLTFSNTLFGQAYAAGNVPASLIPLDTLAALNTANVAPSTGFSSWTTTSANGPVIQFRIQPSVQANVSGNITKVYGTNDPLATAGNLATVGSLDYQINNLFVKNATVNPGYLANNTGGCVNEPSGCMKVTVNGLNFMMGMDNFINSLQALPPTPRTSYGTIAGEQVNGTSATSYTSSYAYNLSSNHGVLVSSGISVNLGTPTGSVGLVITPAPLTITAGNQATQAGSAANLGTTEITISGLVNTVDGVVLGDAVTGATLTASTYTSPYAAGTYAIVPSSAVFAPVTGSNGAANYSITYVNGTLTASSNAIVTITALADSKVYGNSTTITAGLTYNSSGVATFINNVGYSITGMPTGDSLTSLVLTSLGGVSTAGVGSSYLITPSAAVISGSVPVTINYVTGLMTVTPRPITIAATQITTTYGTAATVSQAVTTGYSVSSGTVAAGDTISTVAVNYNNGSANSTTVPGTTGAATYTGAIVPSAATGTGGFNSTNYAITYTPANLVVNPLAVTITANAQSTTYGTALPLGTTAYTSSLSSLPNGDTISGVVLQYNSATTVPGTTNAATYTGANGIIASGASGTGGFNTTNYAITYAPGNLTVNPANVVITPVNVSAAGQTVVYNGATQTFDPSTGFTVTGLQNGQTPVFGTTGLASGLNIGTYSNNITGAIITGLSTGSLSNYNITVASQGSLTITPAPLTVTGATTFLAYNGAVQNNAAPNVVGLVGVDLLSGNGVTVTGIASGTNAGTYTDSLSVAAKGATLLSNYTVTKTNGALTISPLVATITGNTTINTYTGALQTNTYSTTGILSGDTANIVITGAATATHVSQGTVPDTFAVSGAAAGNYTFTYHPGSITITPVALTVTGANTTRVYNATTQTNAAATVTGLMGGDTATIGGAYGSGTHVGTYSDALTVGLSNPSDYTVNVTNGSIAITPATITIGGVTANNKVYDATTAATLNIGTITYAGVYPGDSVTVNASNLTGTFVDKNVGTAKTVNISGIVLAGTSSADYQLSGGANTTTTANITPAPLTITGANLTTTYNASAQSLASPTVSGLIAGDNVVVAGGATGTNAGTYTAAYTATGVDAGNYTVTANAPVLTINKASLVVTANNAATIYGQTDPALTASVSGLQGGDNSSVISPAYTLTRAAGVSTGTYAITAAGPSSVSNYNITYVPGQFTIAQAGSLLINLNAATTTYGTAATPTIASVQYVNGSGQLTNFTTTGGNIYTDGIATTITITPSITGATVTSNVGAYANAVTGTYTGSTSNYTAVTTITNTLTITPAPLELTVANVSKTYDANAVTAAQIAAGSLTGGVASGVTVTGGALMNSQTITGLGGVTYSGSAIGAINASATTYPINGSIGSGFSNYNVTIVNGALTVNQAPLVVNGAVTTTPYNGAVQTNAAATVSGLQGSDSVVVTGYATGTHAGAYTDSLVASGASASNYSITYNNGSMTITPASLLVTGVANQYAYNGALQTNTGASVSGLKGSDTASVSGYATATHVSQGIVPDALVATLSNPADYTVTYVQGSLQITPIVITATVNSATVMYNATEQTTGFVVTGLKGADTATAASGTATGTNVGTYTSNLVLTASSDYTIGAITNGTLTITPAPLTISAGLTANNKVYDATTAATIAVTGNQVLAGVLGTDAVSVSSTGPYTGATFSQSNVGSGLTVTPGTTSTVINGVTYTTMAGVTLTGAAAGNYYVAGVGPQTLTANITPKPITIATGLTASDKVYDGTTAATITSATQTLSGVLPSDLANVSVSSSGPYTGVFSQSNVGANLTVTPSTTATTIAGGTYDAMSGVTLSGSAAGNYYVTGTTTPITAAITPYIINFGAGGTGPNISAVANNKVYTSTTAANGTLAMVNLFGNDSVDVTFASATFANPNVANSIPVTFAGVTLSGASAGNYAIGNTPITSAANITPAPLTIAAIDKASFYTQAIVDLSTAHAPAVGLLGSDTVTGATITTTATNTSAVGTYPISISGATGSGLSNYAINYIPATYTIVGPGGLVIATSGVTTTYGTGTSGNILAPALPTATYTTGGTNISALTYVSSSTTGIVTSYVFKDAANVTVTFDLTPANTTVSGSSNINIGSYPYAASNLSAGTTGLTSAIPSGNFTVTPLAITITATPETHAYNGSVQTQATATSSPAIKTNDLVTVTGAASGKGVGVYGSNLSAAGADIANYNITYVNADLTITPYILGSGGAGTPAITATANNKMYDTATAATGSLVMANPFAGDFVTVNYTTANFATPNVANGLTVTFAGVTLSGPDAANYAVGSSPITATANITPAPLTISAGLTANNKVYDATTAATIAVTGNQVLAGVLGTDAVSVSSTGPYTGATFSQSNVGSGLTVTPGTTSTVINGVTYTTMAGVTLTGAAAGNYYVAGVGPQTLTANITPKPITIATGLTASDKVYDGTTAATITSATQTLSGVLPSDLANVSVSSSGPYTGVFSQSNVGANLTVTPSTTATTIAGGTYDAMSGVTLSGSAAGNYYVTGTTTPITAAITPYIINFGAGGTGPNISAVANNKVYTSTTAANGTLAMVNLFGNDSVDVTFASATFANPNVANSIPVTFAGAALSGPSAANYSIGTGNITAPANITPAPLTVTANDQASLLTQPLGTLSVASSIGLLGGQTVTGASLTTTASTSGPNASAGTYPISISSAVGANGFNANNYTITYVPATYTILPAGQLLVSTSGLTTVYGSTVVSGNIVPPSVHPTLSYLTTGGAVISNLTWQSQTVSGNVVTYTYLDGSNHVVTFSLAPTGITTSTSGNINVGSYTYAATNVSAPGTGLTSTSGIATGDLVVTPLVVTITASATGPLTYNGTLQNQGAVTYSTPILSTAGVGADQVNVSGLAAGKNVGIYGSNLAVSGADTANYAITLVNDNLTITPFVITPGSTTGPHLTTAANNKVYDTTTVATGSLGMAGLFAGDSVAVNYSSAAFASPNVNVLTSPQTVTFSGVTLSGASASNYTIGSGAITATASITPAPVTISGLVANNKVYTSTTVDVITGTPIVTGLLGSDTSTATGTAVGTFASPNVANSIAVAADLSGMTLSNANYVITGLTAPLAANITPAPLTISAGLTAANKVYDTTTAATIAVTGTQTLAGILGSDAANLAVSSSGPYTGAFAQAGAANGLVVAPSTSTTVINGLSYSTMDGVTLSGSAAGNYYVTGPTTALTANITKAPLTITANNQASFVTLNTAPLAYSQIGLLGGDAIASVGLTTTASSSQPAGSYAITAANATGAAMANYNITYQSGTYTIVPAGQVLITTTGATTNYGTPATFANPTVSYMVSATGPVISNLFLTGSTTTSGVTTYTYADSTGATVSFNFAPTNPVMSSSNNVNVGIYGLTAANFVKTGNNITNTSAVVTGDLTVNPLPVTVTATPVTYMYNGTVRTQAYTAPAIFANDSVLINGVATGKNVGSYNSSLTASGVDAANYDFTYVNAALVITPYVINYGAGGSGPGIAAAANNKVYNANTTATGSLTMINLFPGDVVNASFAAANFAGSNVVTGGTVTFAGITLSGAAAGNYSIGSTPITAQANITPAPVTISGLVAANKQYDGNTNAVVTGTPTITGLLGSDTSTLTGSVLSGAFATANPGNAIGVTANLTNLLLGNSNYYIAGVTFPLVADIASPPQTINNMAVVQQQVAQEFVPERPTYLINKGELIYVRDKDNLPEYLQAIEVPSSGAFKFPVPDQIVQELINLSGENVPSAKQAGSYKLLLLPQGSRLVVTLPDGAALPKGIKYDAGSKTFTVPKLGEVTLPLSVKLTLMRGNKVLSQKIMVVTK